MGIDEITDEQIAAQQEIVNGLASKFNEAVSIGRNKPLALVEELATGKTWLDEKAQILGLVDEVNSSISTQRKDAKMAHDEAIEPVAEVATEPITEPIAEDAKAEDVISEAGENVDEPDPVALERGRVVAILAAFAHAPEFANTAITDGLTVEQANAAHYDALLAAKTVTAPAEGVDGIAFVAEAEVSTPQTWGDAVAFIAKRDNIGLAQAGRIASKEFADLYSNRNN